MIKVNNTNIQTVRVEHDGDNVPAIAVIARDTKNNRTRVVYQLEGISFLNVTRVGDLNSEITILNNTTKEEYTIRAGDIKQKILLLSGRNQIIIKDSLGIQIWSGYVPDSEQDYNIVVTATRETDTATVSVIDGRWFSCTLNLNTPKSGVKVNSWYAYFGGIINQFVGGHADVTWSGLKGKGSSNYSRNGVIGIWNGSERQGIRTNLSFTSNTGETFSSGSKVTGSGMQIWTDGNVGVVCTNSTFNWFTIPYNCFTFTVQTSW